MLDAFELFEDDCVKRLREATETAMGCKAGYQCRLLLEDAALEDAALVSGTGLVDDSVVTAICMMDPAVQEMMEHFKQTAQYVRENYLKVRTDDFDPPTQALAELDDLGWYGLWSGRGTGTCVKVGRGIAGPAVPLFSEMIADRDANVRQLAVWALAGVGRDALPALPHLMVALEDGDSEVRNETVTALLHFTKQAPKQMLPVVVRLICHADPLVSAGFISSRDQFLPDIEGAKAAVLPELVKASVIHANMRVRRLARRALKMADREKHARPTRRDLESEELWQEANVRLEMRLREAQTHSESVREKTRQAVSRRLEEATERDAFLERWRVEGEERECVCQLYGCDANRLPVPVRGGFDPLLLREAMHADEASYDPAVKGEAAWQCLPRNVVASSSSCDSTECFPKLRGCEARRRRHFIEGEPRRTRGEFARHFFDKLTKLEGGDPFHQWIFPVKGYPPLQDFEPFHKPGRRIENDEGAGEESDEESDDGPYGRPYPVFMSPYDEE